mgnify:CR=1 FL=1
MRSLFVSLFMFGMGISAFGGYDYTISGGYSDDIILKNSQTLLMTGGGVYEITAKDFSVIEINNTAPFAIATGGIANLIMGDNSKLVFSGGDVYRLNIGGFATAALSGGQINKIYSYQSTTIPNYMQHIEIICKDYSFNSTTNKLTGTWADNTTFNVQLINQTGYSPVIDNIKFTIIPEPATLLLLGLGGVLLRRRQ